MNLLFRCTDCSVEKELTTDNLKLLARYKKAVGRRVKCPKCQQKVGEIVEIERNASPSSENSTSQEETTTNLQLNEVEDKSRTGEVSFFDPQKAFGFVKSSGIKENIFLHIDEVKDSADMPICKDDKVLFKLARTQKGLAAHDVQRQWNYGIIITYNQQKRFGFIKPIKKSRDVYFQARDFYSNLDLLPATGMYVAYGDPFEIRGAKGKQRTRVHPLQKLFGKVGSWSHKTGVILPNSSEAQLTAYQEDIISSVPKNRRRLEVGRSVSFFLSPDDPMRPIQIRTEYALRRFADLGNEEKMLKHLAKDKALKEDWHYKNTKREDPYRILRNYLMYTFERLEYEDLSLPEAEKKIRIARPDDSVAVAIFDTGLVDKQYRPLYAVFEENVAKTLGRPFWNLVGFCPRGEYLNGKFYSTYFEELPSRAEYFENPADLLYDLSLRLDAVTKHIIGDRRSRLPKRIREQIPDTDDENIILTKLSQHLDRAISSAQDRIKWNFKAAIPQYYPKTKSIQLLIPLCIDDPTKVDLALAVQKERKAYVGYTILELDWAYNNARLIARPDSDWLMSTAIDTSNDFSEDDAE